MCRNLDLVQSHPSNYLFSEEPFEVRVVDLSYTHSDFAGQQKYIVNRADKEQAAMEGDRWLERESGLRTVLEEVVEVAGLIDYWWVLRWTLADRAPEVEEARVEA